jgi:iron complex outermembrane receptor protein
VWGIGYRFSRDKVSNTSTIDFQNEQKDHNLVSAFLHDEIALAPGKLALMLGSRFENNDYSGFEVQPNVRLLWTPTVQHSVWGSVSRAVRTPSRGEQDLHYHILTAPQSPLGNVPTRFDYIGNRDFKSEELLAYEIGYRVEPLSRLTFDVAAYYNVYTHLRVVTPGTPDLANAVIPLVVSNDMHGNSQGAELSAEWSPVTWWRIQAAYSYQLLTMNLEGNSVDTVNKGNAERSTPRHQYSLRNGFDLGRQVTVDLWLRRVDRIEQINEISQTLSVPGYVTMDVRVAWKPVRSLELSVVGQNLFAAQHPEFYSDVVNTLHSEIPRSVYGKATFKF